ncbi:hypothetical protein [Pseudobacteroides cellulosolvens]|uniref:Uncharacterized protein n=1 Tax=Pseudobacteroides cellulosolvens ATCC 35603 = DSM 2933 TaxID=398512 RepID=A0A0L6JV69_9FIRM|nr:hypothetical protein [Pseudobacteroides cellulosolvens]KNY29629.1 hypothetical protein Bccel_4903 [Pseudobacteroides cellulosolvens ATCC 35603 = DSM 2933]
MKIVKELDEMEQYIALKSLKIAYWFTVAFLAVWTIVDIAIKKNAYSIPLVLLALQNIILVFFDKYFKRKLGE